MVKPIGSSSSTMRSSAEIEPQAVRLADDGKLFLEQRVEVLLLRRDHLGSLSSVYLVFTSLAVVSRPGLYR